MPDTKEQAKSIKSIQENSTLRNAGATKSFFKELRTKLPMSRPPGEIAATEAEEGDADEESLRERAEDNPFLAYLLDTGNLFSSAADDLSGQIEREYRRAQAENVPVEILCCVVRGLYELAVREGRADDVDSVRKVAEGDVTKWLLLIRNLLVAINNESVDVGIDFEFALMKIDVSAFIFQSIEDLVGLALAIPFIAWVESLISRLNRRMMDAIGYARCAPLIRLWNTVLQWLYAIPSGMMSQVKGFVQDVFMRLHRKIGGTAVGGQKASGRVGFRSGPSNSEFVEDMIVLIDALLDHINLFKTCRLPYDSDLPQAGEGEEGPGDGSDRGGDEDDDDPRDGGGGDDDDRRTRTRRSGGQNPNVRAGFTRADDPDLGEIIEKQSDGESRSYLYFTPENIGKFASLITSVDAREARDLARSESCAEELDTDTQEFLQDLGVLPDE